MDAQITKTETYFFLFTNLLEERIELGVYLGNLITCCNKSQN